MKHYFNRIKLQDWNPSLDNHGDIAVTLGDSGIVVFFVQWCDSDVLFAPQSTIPFLSRVPDSLLFHSPIISLAIRNSLLFSGSYGLNFSSRLIQLETPNFSFHSFCALVHFFFALAVPLVSARFCSISLYRRGIFFSS